MAGSNHPYSPYAMPLSFRTGRSSSSSLGDIPECPSVASSNSRVGSRCGTPDEQDRLAASSPDTASHSSDDDIQEDEGLPELPADPILDPDLHQALDNVTQWRANTYQELRELPQRNPYAFSDGTLVERDIWTFMSSLAGCQAASLLRPFTPEEQQALEEGHAVLSRRMGELQDCLFHLSQLLGERTAQLQQAGAGLADTLNYNDRLMYEINHTEAISQKHLTKLIQADIHLEAAKAKVMELQGAVSKLQTQVAAGETLAGDMKTTRAQLELVRDNETATHTQQMEELRAQRQQLQQRYSYAVLLQQDLDNLHALCTKQKQDLQAARQQLAAVRQQNLDAVADVDQRAAAERHVVIQTGRGLWEEWRGAREQLSGLNDKLQQTNADTDATVLELGETCQAGQQHKVELKTLFANNGVLKEEVWRLELDLEQLKDEFTEAAAALEVAEAELERGKAEEKMVTPPMSADLFKKTARVAELLEDKQRLDGIILALGQRMQALGSKIAAASAAKDKALRGYSTAASSAQAYRQSIHSKNEEIKGSTAAIKSYEASIEAFKAKAPEYARVKKLPEDLNRAQNKLTAAFENKRRQMNALRDHSAKANKIHSKHEEGEKTFKEKAIQHKQLETELAGQQQQTQAEQQTREMAQAARLNKIAAAERRKTALLAEFDIGDRPQKKTLLDEATKVQGKLSEAEAKVGSRIRSRDGLQAERDARLKAIAGAEQAARKMDAATEAKAAELQEQRSSTQRAYADKANSERSCQELGAQINRLTTDAANQGRQLKQIQFKIKQLTKRYDVLMAQAKEAGIAVEDVAVAAGAHVAAGAGVAGAAGSGAGVAAQQGYSSVAARPLRAAPAWDEGNWPSLGPAGSSPVKGPRSGR